MATLTRVTLVPVGYTTAGATLGQSVAYQAAAGGGDLIPISSGRGTIFRIKSTGTAVTATLVCVAVSNYGVILSPTMVLAATDEQEIFIANDGYGRFDQGVANPQLMSVTYSQVVGISVAAKTVP
jgi:hypothetical protein